MDSPSDDFPELEYLDQYLAGEGTEADVARVTGWASDPRHLQRAEWLAAVQARRPHDISTDDALARVKAMIARGAEIHTFGDARERSEEHPRTSGVPGGNALTPRRAVARAMSSLVSWRGQAVHWRGVAAACGGALALVFACWGLWQRYVPQGAPAATYVATSEPVTVTLPDGSIVTLDEASRLQVPRGFGTTTRTVRLVGDARFQVTHAGGIPFIVSAGATRAEVLGTSFGVQAYMPEDVHVVVYQGRVSISAARSRRVVLGAQDYAHVDGAGTLVVSHASADGIAMWESLLAPGHARAVYGGLFGSRTTAINDMPDTNMGPHVRAIDAAYTTAHTLHLTSDTIVADPVTHTLTLELRNLGAKAVEGDIELHPINGAAIALAGIPTHVVLAPFEHRRISVTVVAPQGSTPGVAHARLVTSVYPPRRTQPHVRRDDQRFAYVMPVEGYQLPVLRDSAIIAYRWGK